MKSKKIIIPVLLLGVLMLAGILWAGGAAVQAANQSVVDKIAERFNLNKDEVTGVFDEMQQERQQEKQKYMESRLDEAVKDGVITADQKQSLVNKQAEMQEKNKQMRDEMKQWMDQSGIDFGKLASYRVGFGGKGFGGLGFGRGHGFWKGF